MEFLAKPPTGVTLFFGAEMEDFQEKCCEKMLWSALIEAKTPGDSGGRDFVVSSHDPNSKIIRDL